MSVPLYMDHNVQSAVTSQLRARGIDVLTAFEDGTHEMEDVNLMERATELERVLFSQDDDFLAIARQHQSDGHPFSGLIFGHQLKTTIGQCVEDLELISNCSNAEELRSQIQFIPL